jgi:hypothetical protein
MILGSMLVGRCGTKVRNNEGRSVNVANDDGFPKLPAPARRALAGAGYSSPEQLAHVESSELEKLHGVGPRALAAIRLALAQGKSGSLTGTAASTTIGGSA